MNGVVDDVKKADEEMVKAEAHQKSTGKCIYYLACFTFLAVVGLVLWLVLK